MPIIEREIRTKDDKQLVYQHGSYEEYLDACERPASEGWGTPQSRSGSKSFTATKSFEEAMDLAHFGWPDGKKKFAKIVGDIATRFSHNRPSLGFDVGGMYPHVPRFVGGDPESMVTFSPDINASKHIIPIYVSYTYVASTSSSEIMNRGGAIAALIDQLEDTGHSVRLIAVEHCTMGKNVLWSECVVKEAGEPLDIDRMCFVLVHPSMLRRIQFANQEALGYHFDGDFEMFTGTYGSVGTGFPSGVPDIEDVKRGLFFDGVVQGSHFRTSESAAAFVLKEYNKALERMETAKELA